MSAAGLLDTLNPFFLWTPKAQTDKHGTKILLGFLVLILVLSVYYVLWKDDVIKDPTVSIGFLLISYIKSLQHALNINFRQLEVSLMFVYALYTVHTICDTLVCICVSGSVNALCVCVLGGWCSAGGHRLHCHLQADHLH